MIVSCDFWRTSTSSDTYPDVWTTLKTTAVNGPEWKVQLAISEARQKQGVSGVRAENWPDDQGLLFLFEDWGPRGFWMPDTHFDLDLFFLDDSLKVIDLQRSVPHFIGRYPEERIPRAKVVWARHVLELKSSAPQSKQLNLGDQLILELKDFPQEIKSYVHRPQ